MTPIHTVSSLALVAKAGNILAEKASRTIHAWLKQRGIQATCVLHPEDNLLNALVPNTDLILVLGGDGSMVSVTRRTLGSNIPICGINYGQVGFLTELSDHNWEVHLARILQEGCGVESRMSLVYALYRGGERIRKGEVVNEVVVTRGKVARLVRLHLCVNGEHFMELRSDGLILSTPTGSSGYAGSAGGPLIHPVNNVYVVTAICAYLCSFPPMVLTPETVFSAVVGESAPDLYLTLDGQESYPLAEGDRLEVWGWPERIQLADLGLIDYFERLRQAGFVQESRTGAVHQRTS